MTDTYSGNVTIRHQNVTEMPGLAFWRAVDADLAKRGLAGASGKEISNRWLTTTDPVQAAADIARARTPLLVVVEGGRE